MSAFQGKILGYGKASGTRSVAMSAADKEELKRKTRMYNARHRQDEERRISETKNGIEDAMFALYEKGITDLAQYMAIAKRYAGDSDIYRWAVMRANSFAGHSTSGGGSGGRGGGSGYGKMSRDDIAIMKDNIDTGRYVDEGVLLDVLDNIGASPADRRSIVKHYRDWQNDAIDWASQKKDFQREYGKNESLWRGAKEATQDFIQDYVEKNKRQPSYSQIKEALAKAVVKPQNSWLASNSYLADYEQMGLSNATMRAMRMSNARPNGDGTVTVTYPNGDIEKWDEDKFNAQVSKNS